jgi:hypothetical protein
MCRPDPYAPRSAGLPGATAALQASPSTRRVERAMYGKFPKPKRRIGDDITIQILGYSSSTDGGGSRRQKHFATLTELRLSITGLTDVSARQSYLVTLDVRKRTRPRTLLRTASARSLRADSTHPGRPRRRVPRPRVPTRVAPTLPVAFAILVLRDSVVHARPTCDGELGTVAHRFDGRRRTLSKEAESAASRTARAATDELAETRIVHPVP